jgi:hypothetical protein
MIGRRSLKPGNWRMLRTCGINRHRDRRDTLA